MSPVSSSIAAFVGFSLAVSLETLVSFDPEPAHIVGTGGAIGAICRHYVYLHVSWEDFPAATLTVNVIGSFVFAIVLFAGAGESILQLIAIGACGAFTTFSTFSVDTVQLFERGDRRLAVLSAGSNLLVSLAAIGFGWLIVTLL